MTWDDRTLSALHHQHNPRLSTAQVARLADWCANRCRQSRVENPTALLVACLKRAQPEPEPTAPTPPRQHRPDRSWRRDLQPMSPEQHAAAEAAMRAELARIRAILDAPNSPPTDFP